MYRNFDQIFLNKIRNKNKKEQKKFESFYFKQMFSKLFVRVSPRVEKFIIVVILILLIFFKFSMWIWVYFSMIIDIYNFGMQFHFGRRYKKVHHWHMRICPTYLPVLNDFFTWNQQTWEGFLKGLDLLIQQKFDVFVRIGKILYIHYFRLIFNTETFYYKRWILYKNYYGIYWGTFYYSLTLNYKKMILYILNILYIYFFK